MKNNLLLSLMLWFAATTLMATNIQIENIEIVERNNENQYIVVQFDLSWDYSFRVEDGDNDNWDAAWVFMKYKFAEEENVSWKHAILDDEGHALPSNYTYSLGETGEVNKGMFVYRSNVFNGKAEINNMRMRWHYGANGVAQDAEVDIRIFGVEMVYVPQGSFFVGSGGAEEAAFQNATSGNPLQIGSSIPTLGTVSGNLWAKDGDNISPVSLSGNYPTGHTGFYMMKHSITQQAYVDFLNTLSPAQQSIRINIDDNNNRRNISQSGGTYSTTLHHVPVNHLSPEDLLAYLDWAALRPYTELEYEKAARGPSTPVAGEYVWGNTRIGAVTGLTNVGQETEGASASGYQRDIFVDPSRVSENIENFTVLVRLTEDNFNFNNAHENGHDIRFFSTNGNELPFERERHSRSAQKAEYWVTLPQLNSVQTTVFTMEYGGSSDDYENIEDTWSPLTDLVSLWHLHESGGESFSDSKGDNVGNTTDGPLVTQADGQIGPTQQFDGSKHISVAHHESLDITEAITLSAWVKPEELSGITISDQWNNHWNNSNNAVLDNLAVADNKVTLADPDKHLGHRITGPISLDAIKSAGSSSVSWEFEPGYTIQAFKEDDFFQVPEGVTQVDVLVVAGGGGGGAGISRRGGGGGGAGGVVFEQNVSVNTGNIIPISVGQGGQGGIDNNTAGQNGGNSSFGTLVDEAIGGGRGGQYSNFYPGETGGSGGGSAAGDVANTIGAFGTNDQGYAGGGGVNQTQNNRGGAGGGGAGGVGGQAAQDGDNNGGNGGVGVNKSNFFGVGFGDNGSFASGGGGGRANNNGTAGNASPGGGASGGSTSGSDNVPHATPNTGGGGGGGYGDSGPGGDGGSGIILVRYKDPKSVRVFAHVTDNDQPAAAPGLQIFDSPGTNNWTVPAGVTQVEVLVVGGGGAGGDHTDPESSIVMTGGGGGAGGVVYETAFTIESGTTEISVKVGAGGQVITNERGGKGGNSQFGSLVAYGGGGGVPRSDDDAGGRQDGASGGGSGSWEENRFGQAIDEGDGLQGHDGGDTYKGEHPRKGGGGGGFTEAGETPDQYSARGGKGGDGLGYYISGLLKYYGAGGGGGAGQGGVLSKTGLGGLGGGGRGGFGWFGDDDVLGNATNALPNTGSGGGGAGSRGTQGGAGGSGIVIVRWGQEVTKGGSIPGIAEGEDLSGKYLWIRQELSSNSEVAGFSPVLDRFDLEIKGEPVIAGKGKDTYQLSYYDNEFRAYVNNEKVSASVLTYDEYQHVAMRYNGEYLRLYVNGGLAGNRELTGSIETNAEHFLMGYNLIGEIDEVRLYNASKPQSWLQAEYHTGMGSLLQVGGEGQNNNAVFGSYLEEGFGPARVGFGAGSSGSRTASGASYWGIMELSGNLWEQVLHINTSFNGSHGNGLLDASGRSTIFWPENTDLPAGDMGRRGGAFNTDSQRLRVSDREKMNNSLDRDTRDNATGGRGVRTAPTTP